MISFSTAHLRSLFSLPVFLRLTMGIFTNPTTKDAYRLSIVSLLCTIAGAIGGIVLFTNTGSSLCLVFGLENCVDFLSSVIVLWRFFAPSDVSPELEHKLRQREKRASVGISYVLVLLGIGVFGAAVNDFRRGQEDADQYKKVIGLSFLSFIVFSVLSLFKFRYANALDSASLYKDGICSLIGTVLSGALFVDSILIEISPSLWWIDPLVALGCGLAAFYLGVSALYRASSTENLPIFSISWWFMSHGDGEDLPDSSKPIGNSGGLEMPQRGDDELV